MKKILFVCDGDHFSDSTFEFIRLLHEQEKISVKGIFFMPDDAQEIATISFIPSVGPYERLKHQEIEMVKSSKNRFESLCIYYGIKYHINETEEEWSQSLIEKETKFSDLLVVSEGLFFDNVSDCQPNTFLREILCKSECPVILVPECFKTVDRIVFAYNGKRDSLFALKQFFYLFPFFDELPVEMVYVTGENNADIPDAQLLKEYSKLHFSNMELSILHMDADKYFATWIDGTKNTMLVSGSFGRNPVSNFLKDSFSVKVINAHKVPVFIAHK